MQEVNSHSAPVWTFIYSLKREDAVRLGYDSAESWRKLLLAHQAELAEAVSVTRQTIISLESGRYNASLLLAHKIAKYFETAIEDIFLFEEEES